MMLSHARKPPVAYFTPVRIDDQLSGSLYAGPDETAKVSPSVVGASLFALALGVFLGRMIRFS